MAAEHQLLFDLFDSYWFSQQILNKPQTPLSKYPKKDESVTQNLDFSTVPMINVRCQSDQHNSSVSNSPNSVLDLQSLKIESKEVTVQVKSNKNLNLNLNKGVRRRKMNNNINNKAKSKSKSLTEHEFEELKGFMDLGFLFSEKDKESSLVSMIPGLQRLGKDDVKEHHDVADGYVNVSRPYLSEAWGDTEKMKEQVPRMIRIPVNGNEADIKHQLRFWAHSVASVVR